jgi:hypothetical protein
MTVLIEISIIDAVVMRNHGDLEVIGKETTK